MASSDGPGKARSTLLLDLAKAGLPLLVFLLLAAAWQFTPLRELAPQLREAMSALRDMPAAPAIVVAVFVLGGLVVAPVSVLILGSVITFGAVLGGLYALVGALASASVVFSIGRLIGRGPVDRILGERAERAEELLGRHGVVSVAVARNIPVAPYSVINLIAGASPLRFRDYFFGTLLGFLPTLIALAVVGDRIAGFFENPDQGSLLSLAGLIAVVAVVAVLAGRWLVKRNLS